MNRFAIVANVFPDLHAQPTGMQRYKPFTEMADRQCGAKEKIGRNGWQQHEDIYQNEAAEIQPTKTARIQPLFRNQWHSKDEPTLNHAENCDCAEHLKNRHRPNHDLHPIGEINPKRQRNKGRKRTKQCNQNKLSFWNHWRNSHQRVDYQPKYHGQKTDETAKSTQ